MLDQSLIGHSPPHHHLCTNHRQASQLLQEHILLLQNSPTGSRPHQHFPKLSPRRLPRLLGQCSFKPSQLLLLLLHSKDAQRQQNLPPCWVKCFSCLGPRDLQGMTLSHRHLQIRELSNLHLPRFTLLQSTGAGTRRRRGRWRRRNCGKRRS